MQPLAKPNPPLNTYKPAAPFRARVVSVAGLTPQNAMDEIKHIVFDVRGAGYEFMEGQSMGIIAPGERAPGKSHQVRLYSIASPRGGENDNPDHIALCVKRATHVDAQTGEPGQGVCSSYLCELQPGDEVAVTGPSGKAFVIPDDPAVDLILIATGTGIAPYRSFLGHMYREISWQGQCLLFYGAKTRREYSYLNTENEDLAAFKRDGVFISEALSRENPGQKVYVQHRLLQEGQKIASLLKKGNCAIYLCGLKGMEQGIEDAFQEIAGGSGPWEELRSDLKKTGRWNVEVY